MYGAKEHADYYCCNHGYLTETQTQIGAHNSRRCSQCNTQVRLRPTPSRQAHAQKVTQRRHLIGGLLR